MEMVLNTDEGIIISSEEIKLKIGIDDIMYYPIDYESINDIKRIHFIELHHGFIFINKEKKETKLIIPIKNEDKDDIMFNKNNSVKIERLKLFICYYNYYISCYFYNIQCYEILTKTQHSLNSKELYLNMNLYVTKKYFKEMANKMNSYKPLFLSALSVIENRCKNDVHMKMLFYMNNGNNLDENGYLKVIEEMKSLYENIYDKLIDKDKNTDENIIVKNKNYNIFICNEYKLENIDKMKEYYLNLIRILNELKRSFYERIVSNKYDIHDINNIERNKLENKLDICTRFYYIKFKNKNFSEFKFMNNPYISQNQKLKKENENLISKLKLYLEKNNIQIYICFRCGNLLFKSSIKEKSTCNFDNNCFNISFFFCKICNINFCSYCIHYPKDLKCLKNHDIKKLKRNELINLKNEKYKCELCGKNELKNNISCCIECNDSFICKKCKEEADKTMLVKYKCNCGNYLFWRRGLLKICAKCKTFNNCFWICFFCKKMFCVNCFRTFQNKCGLMHELKKICLDDEHENINKNKIQVKDIFINKILIRFNCDVCKNKFFSIFFYCSRCNFIKCYKCNK